LFNFFHIQQENEFAIESYIMQIFVVFIECRCPTNEINFPTYIYLLDGPACEKDDTLQPLVVEEIVERPQTARLTIRIRIQVRIVTVNVTIGQADLVLDRCPQRLTQFLVLLVGAAGQVTVNGFHDPLHGWFLGEFAALSMII
jgi:hypothetical protein